MSTLKYRTAGYALVALFTISTTGLSAEPTCPPVAAMPTPTQFNEAKRQARDRGVLWQLEKDGLQSYLYSTFHLGKLAWAVPGRLVTQALRQADIFAMEIDPTDPAVAKGMNVPQAPQDTPVVSPALRRRLQALATKACVPWEQLEALPPVMIVVTLEMLDARWVGLDGAYGSEIVFGGFANATGKPIVMLETVATQRAALLGGSPAEQIDRIERGVSALETGATRKSLALLAEAWANSDLERIEREWCGCDTRDASEDLERLAFSRNPALAASIAELHRSGKRVFAAIGILHMVGDKAVQKLLLARGFKVERVAFSGAKSLPGVNGSSQSVDPAPARGRWRWRSPRDGPALAHIPEAAQRHRRGALDVGHLRRQDLGDDRNQIVQEARGQQLPVLGIDQLLE